jgi:hypothetical protein
MLGPINGVVGKCWSCTWGCGQMLVLYIERGQILGLVHGGVGKCFVLYTEYGQMLGTACGGVDNVLFCTWGGGQMFGAAAI